MADTLTPFLGLHQRGPVASENPANGGVVTAWDFDVNMELLDAYLEAHQPSGGGTWGSITGTLSNQTDLEAALTALANSVTSEASTRASADTVLAAAIVSETNSRSSADTTLQTNINTEASTRGTADTNEASARAAADTTLQTNITNEATSRASADTTLQTNINTEASTRSSADTTLQTNINTEASTRATADTNESTARASADTTLQTNINTEASTRGTADTTLQTNITAEAAARAAADALLLPLAGGTVTGPIALGATGTPANGAGSAYSASASASGSALSLTVNVGDFVVLFALTPTGMGDNGTGLVLTQVQGSINGNSVYTGTITGGASNGHVGKLVAITTFANLTNNGVFLCVGSSATTLTLNNPMAVTETHAGAANNAYIHVDGSTTSINGGLWICPGALVAATTITGTGSGANGSISGATFTGVGGIGVWGFNQVTTTPGTVTVTTTVPNSTVVTLFDFFSASAAITASSSTGTLRNNLVSGNNTFHGFAIVTTQTTTVGAVTCAVALSATSTDGMVFFIELIPAGTNFNSTLLKFNSAYWNGNAAITDQWSVQAVAPPACVYPQGYFYGTASIVGGFQVGGGIGAFGYGATPAQNQLQIVFAGEGGGVLCTPAQMVTGSIQLQPLAAPAAPTVTPTGANTAKTWSYKIIAFDANDMWTEGSATGTTAAGTSPLNSTNFITITWTAVPGAAYYRIYRVATGGVPSVLGCIGTINAGQTLSIVDDGGAVYTNGITVPTLNWTGGINFGGTFLAPSTPTSLAYPTSNGLKVTTQGTAFASWFQFYVMSANGFGTQPVLAGHIGVGNTSDANDRLALVVDQANTTLYLSGNRTSLNTLPHIILAGTGNTNFTGITSGEYTLVAVAATLAESTSGPGGHVVFAPPSGVGTFTPLRVTATVNQVLAATATIAGVQVVTNVVTLVFTGVPGGAGAFINSQYIVVTAGTNTAVNVANGVALVSTNVNRNGSTITNIVETAGSVVTLTVGTHNMVANDYVYLTGLTTGTWLNGKVVKITSVVANTSITFTDPTSHGTQATHADTGTTASNYVTYPLTTANITLATDTGTAQQQASGNYTAIKANMVETALGAPQGSNLLLDLQAGATGGASRYKIDNLGNATTTAGNGEQIIEGSASELLTLSTSGLTTDTVGNLLPANAIIDAVVVRVVVALTTTTNWAVGDATTSARFATANATLTAGTTAVGLNHQQGGVTTNAAGPVQSTAAKVRITCTGSNPGAGQIRITVFYRQFVAPSS